MRHLISIFLILVLLFCLVGCGQSPSGWQEQYDLGVRYLSEGNYEEAVIAFSAAIGIDPKQLDAYISLAEAYIALSNYDKAAGAVAQGREACGDNETFDRLLDEIFARQTEAEAAGQQEDDAVSDEKNVVDAADEEEDDGSGLNAYGATLFSLRENYLAFADMTPEQQQLIETAGNAAISNDTNAMYSLLNTVNVDPFEAGASYTGIYTMWNGYKMKLIFRPYSAEEDMESFQSGSICVTLRPKSGMGYYCETQLSAHTLDYGGGGNGYYEQWIACPCADWQWNGEFNCIGQNYSLSYNEEHITTREYTNTFSESGQIIDNLLDGVLIQTTHAVGNFGPNTRDEISDSETRMVFKNSVLVENSEEIIFSPIVRGKITVLVANGIDDLGASFASDFLYW